MRISDWSSDVCSSDLDAALARATAALRSAEAEEVEARRSLATRLGATTTPERLTGDATTPILPTIAADAKLDVQLAKAERAITEAELGQARAEGRVDTSLGIGVRHVLETGDDGLVACFSIPLPIFTLAVRWRTGEHPSELQSRMR